MDENNQDKTESKLIATEETLPPSSPQDQSKPEHQTQSHAGKALTKPSTSKALHRLLAIALSIAMVGVIVLIYLWFRLNWLLWSLILLTLVGILLLIFLIREGYYAQWTGFREYVKETKGYTDGQSTTTTRDHQPGKTLWDWLQLLIIPFVLAVLAIGFSVKQNSDSLNLNNSQYTQNLNIAATRYVEDKNSALDQQQATTLQTYIDNIQELLLKDNLLKSRPNDDAAILARARTLTALQGLDSNRKGVLLKFIYEAHLIGYLDNNNKTHDPIIDLSSADLEGAVLTDAVLTDADLSYADLNGANLANADLKDAVLAHADFGRNAHLEDADLTDADLSYAVLGDADLNETILVRADLSYAVLAHADLEGADLTDADLSYAVLGDALDLTQDQLDQVFACRGATPPIGLTCLHNQ